MAYSTPRTWTTGEIPTAAHMNQEVRDNMAAVVPTNAVTATSWTPVLDEASGLISTSSTVGRRWRVGPIQFVWVRWVISSVDAGAGVFFVTLPVTPSGVTNSTSLGQVLGSWSAFDSSASGNSESGAVYLRTSTTASFWRPIGTNISGTTPFAWAINDVLTFQAVYPVA